MDSPPRRMLRRFGRVLPLLVAALLAAGGAQANPPSSIIKDANTNNIVAPSGITIKEATAIARARHGGRVLAAKPYRRGGTNGYEVRLLIDGERVKHVIVDQHGRIVRQGRRPDSKQ